MCWTLAVYLFTVKSMSDDKTSTGAAAATGAASSQATISRLPLPQVKPPPPLNLLECSAKKWKLWKQTWLNFAIASKIYSQDAQYQKVLFLCTIGGALEIFNAFQCSESEDPNNVDTIISKFEEYFTGEIAKRMNALNLTRGIKKMAKPSRLT